MKKSTTQDKRRLVDVGVRRWRKQPCPDVPSLPNMSVVRLVPVSRLVPGLVVWARVPYQDEHAYKIRPVVVLHRRGRVVVGLPCTSAESRHRYPGSLVELRHPHDAGLRRRTGVRRAAICLDRVDILGVVGSLSDVDAARVRAVAIVPSLLRRASE